MIKSKNEFKQLEGIKILLVGARHQGKTPIEDIFTNPRIYLMLYKYGLYTIEDLIDYGPAVYQLLGFGKYDKIQFKNILLALGITKNSFEQVLNQYKTKENLTKSKSI